jgi:hypothetical protein
MMSELVREIKVNGERFIVPDIRSFNDPYERPTELCEVLLVEECLGFDCARCIFDKTNFNAFCEYMQKGEDTK